MDATDESLAFLDLLGLDESARERDIRGAYARRLKRIDPEQDPEGFQRLRTAYETALDWAQWKLRQAEAEQAAMELPVEATQAAASPIPEPLPASAHNVHDVPDVPDVPQAPALPDPNELAHIVFQRLAEKIPGLAARREARDDLKAWRDELLLRLDDEELVNIDARITFEAIVATVLAQGWRPGHESLFVAAQEVFGWNEDRRRLLQFGRAGALLDHALAEQALFLSLPHEEQRLLRMTARLLRAGEPPEPRQVRASMRSVEELVARFPALMRVVVDLDNVEYWRAAYRQQGSSALEPVDELPEPPKPASRVWTGGGKLLLIMMVLAVLRLLPDSGSTVPPELLALEPPVISPLQMETLLPPIRFTPGPEAKPGLLHTRVRIFLDQDMRVERTQNVETSGEPAFDQAVKEAFAAAKPFPLGTPREFDLTFTAFMTPGTGGTPEVSLTPTLRRPAGTVSPATHPDPSPPGDAGAPPPPGAGS